ncbi:hypothetical protein ACWCPQ_08220 [Nocardia sp. NPDC001965]
MTYSTYKASAVVSSTIRVGEAGRARHLLVHFDHITDRDDSGLRPGG